jgi:DNA-binding GntR family transcriptional regulator
MERNRTRPLPPSRTTPDLLADAIRDSIARGEPPPGGALRQEALAERFGVSRIPVREALRRLEAEGLVVVHPNRGAYVSRLDAAELQEIYDLRIMLEGDLLARAIAKFSRDDLATIGRAMMVAEDSANGPRWSEFDDAFHLTLYAPARRPRQLAMVATLRGAVKHYRRAHHALPAKMEEWLRDHRHILAACRRGDVGAACDRLSRHLTRAAKVMIERAASAESVAERISR